MFPQAEKFINPVMVLIASDNKRQGGVKWDFEIGLGKVKVLDKQT